MNKFEDYAQLFVEHFCQISEKRGIQKRHVIFNTFFTPDILPRSSQKIFFFTKIVN